MADRSGPGILHNMRQAQFDSTRLAALSDGLFAIALTLLVLDLKLPALDFLGAGSEANSESTERALLRQVRTSCPGF